MSDCFIFFLPDKNGGVETLIQNYVKAIAGNSIKVIKYKIADSLFTKIHKASVDNTEQFEIAFSKYSTQTSKFKLLSKLITCATGALPASEISSP